MGQLAVSKRASLLVPESGVRLTLTLNNNIDSLIRAVSWDFGFSLRRTYDTSAMNNACRMSDFMLYIRVLYQPRTSSREKAFVTFLLEVLTSPFSRHIITCFFRTEQHSTAWWPPSMNRPDLVVSAVHTTPGQYHEEILFKACPAGVIRG